MGAKKTSIALFIPTLYGGGAQRVMVNLANGFVEAGYSVDLVVRSKEGDLAQEVADQVNLVNFDVSALRYSLVPFVRYLWERQPTAMLSTLPFANILAICARFISGVDTRLVIREANTLDEITGENENIRNRVLWGLMKMLYDWADALVANSQDTKDGLVNAKFVKSEGIKVINNPVVTASLLSEATQKAGHPWLDEKNMPVIVGVGRLEKQKNFGLLIDAFCHLYSKKNARLIILGKGSMKNNLKNKMKKYGLENVVDMPGYVRNPVSYMSKADVFVLSSLYEGFGNVIVEALAAGTPVVSTDCPGGPSEILEDGKWGELVPVGDDYEMASQIEKVLGDPPDSEMLRRRARCFSIDDICAEYLKVLIPTDREQ